MALRIPQLHTQISDYDTTQDSLPINKNQELEFKKKLIQKYHAINPIPKANGYWGLKLEELWCPITKQYHPQSKVSATHIFPYEDGEGILSGIGVTSTSNVLFRPENGLLMCEEAKKFFEEGYFVIVPVNNESVPGPQEYRIRVLNLTGDGMDNAISSDDVPPFKWKYLDGRLLEFKSYFRPDPGYLFHHYLTLLLKNSDRIDEHWKKMKSKLPYLWAVKARYMNSFMLLNDMEELGRGFEFLMEFAKGMENYFM